MTHTARKRLIDLILVAHAAWFEEALLNRALRLRRWSLGRAVIDRAAVLRGCRPTPVGSPPRRVLRPPPGNSSYPSTRHTTPHARRCRHDSGNLPPAREQTRAAPPVQPSRQLSVHQLCELSQRYQDDTAVPLTATIDTGLVWGLRPCPFPAATGYT
jgi:hypothetical protein